MSSDDRSLIDGCGTCRSHLFTPEILLPLAGVRRRAVEASSQSERINAVVMPGFDLFDLTAICDAMGMARGLPDQPVPVLSLTGGVVECSSGLAVATERAHCLVDEGRSVFVFIGGCDTPLAELRSAASWVLERSSAPQSRFAGMSYGILPLLESGLLDGRVAAAPWECLERWRQRYPRARLEGRLFCLDDPVATCAGRASAVDFAVSMIGARNDARAAKRVGDRLNCTRVRRGEEPQRKGLQDEPPTDSAALRVSVTLMRHHVERPLPTSDIARHAGVHPRQLQRLFQKNVGMTPSRFYMKLRLQHARDLLRNTHLRIAEIAEITGFVSPSNFTLRYRSAFGLGPRRDRQRLL